MHYITYLSTQIMLPLILYLILFTPQYIVVQIQLTNIVMFYTIHTFIVHFATHFEFNFYSISFFSFCIHKKTNPIITKKAEHIIAKNRNYLFSNWQNGKQIWIYRRRRNKKGKKTEAKKREEDRKKQQKKRIEKWQKWK